MEHLLYFTAAFAATCAAVGIFRKWAARRQILDIPNERSSHKKPVPRGGGLPLVAVCLSIYTIYTVYTTENFQPGYLAGALLIALISWLDDLFSVSYGWRFSAHAAAALLAVGGVGYFEKISLPLVSEPQNLGAAAGILLTCGSIVWLTNAYNFMDGIDGIAGIQAASAGVGWLFVGHIGRSDANELYGGVLAFSAIGFLIYNWQPAKVFMGDVGSAFLGYTFAVLPLLWLRENAAGGGGAEQQAIFCGAVLVWLFLVDTIITLTRRIFKGEKIWRAHRTHIYQQLTTNGWSHQSVAALYGVVSFANALLLAGALWSGKKVFYVLLYVFLIAEAVGLTIAANLSAKRKTPRFKIR